jgi:hypothetical protein
MIIVLVDLANLEASARQVLAELAMEKQPADAALAQESSQHILSGLGRPAFLVIRVLHDVYEGLPGPP